MGILNRLYLSWIYLVGAIGIIGFIVSSAIVIHDSYTAYNSFSKYNKFPYDKVNPNGNTVSELNKIEMDLYLFQETLPKELFVEGCAAGAFLLIGSSVTDLLKRCENAFVKLPKQSVDIDFGCGFAFGNISKNGKINIEFLKQCKSLAVAEVIKNEQIRKKDFIEKIEKNGFKVYENSNSTVDIYLKGLWGDHDMSNLGYLWMCSLWIFISLAVIVISFLLKKWLKYIFMSKDQT